MIVGLTGGIGSGKSTVAKFFKALGVPVYDSDVQAKRIMKSSKKIRKKIIALLGEEAYEDKSLNRAYIAKSVFGNKELLEELSGIVHPAVRKHFLKWSQKQDYPYVVQETALLFENKSNHLYDKVILVTAPQKLRIARVMSRDKSTQEQVLARIENQLADTDKIELSDYIIENIDLKETKDKVIKLNKALLEYC
ncbi:dephospho-CoA kinase [Maribacter sp. R77961]|uniref:dephospho-CoA kinase n=1 Tax=Maribacter sp. R77961 TaxID=3093871 RepID=UPI0037C88831